MLWGIHNDLTRKNPKLVYNLTGGTSLIHRPARQRQTDGFFNKVTQAFSAKITNCWRVQLFDFGAVLADRSWECKGLWWRMLKSAGSQDGMCCCPSNFLESVRTCIPNSGLWNKKCEQNRCYVSEHKNCKGISYHAFCLSWVVSTHEWPKKKSHFLQFYRLIWTFWILDHGTFLNCVFSCAHDGLD